MTDSLVTIIPNLIGSTVGIGTLVLKQSMLLPLIGQVKIIDFVH